MFLCNAEEAGVIRAQKSRLLVIVQGLKESSQSAFGNGKIKENLMKKLAKCESLK